MRCVGGFCLNNIVMGCRCRGSSLKWTVITTEVYVICIMSLLKIRKITSSTNATPKVLFSLQLYLHDYNAYTERKTDPKSRYFPMFESTFEKCLIQLSVELIQLDIVYDSLNYTLNQLYRELNETFLESWFKLREVSGFGVCFFSVYIVDTYLWMLHTDERRA